MNRVIKIILHIFVLCTIYFMGINIHCQYISRYYAKEISRSLASHDISKLDNIFKDETIININGKKKMYSQCRKSLGAACELGIPIQADSYGYYSGWAKKNIKYDIYMQIEGMDAGVSLELTRGYGMKYTLKQIDICFDPNGIAKKIFFADLDRSQ